MIGIREILSMLFLFVSMVSFVISAIGVFRMKDFYCRLHAASISESAGLLLAAIGLFLYEGLTSTGLKIFLVLFAVFMASPIGTHIICKVAYDERKERKERKGK